MHFDGSGKRERPHICVCVSTQNQQRYSKGVHNGKETVKILFRFEMHAVEFSVFHGSIFFILKKENLEAFCFS